ncbi:type IV secretion system protein VirB11 [Rheinheimera pacifica]|uniref:P-type conjugative transfer ATPase TrbB n=1 Tax=Rheinheimera pacifica TaxID=173990 RepID=UPI00216723FB|nr:P-type conjugative transfer ATPase TrbB [Rheinheimera pacifica]MCS4309494.1 type IV secretion system protein VirB11 [Rheinheimera pacifica]
MMQANAYRIHSLEDALGFQLLELLNREDVIEVWLNSDGKLFAESLKQGKWLTDISISPERAKNIITTIAGSVDKIVDENNPLLDATLLINNARFSGAIPPACVSPHFNMRKQATIIYSLDDMVRQGNITESGAAIIRQLVAKKRNILISGSTGSGKTTFSNAVLLEMSKTGDRLIIIEDTPELQCGAEDYQKLQVCPGADLLALVRSVLRKRPDRAIVGELRGAEAHGLLKLWNTGHPGGLATLHADSALDALSRIEDLVAESIDNPPKRLIYKAVHCVIFMEKVEGGARRVTSIAEVCGHDGTDYKVNELLE